MLLIFVVIGLALMPQEVPAPERVKYEKTIAMSAIEYSQKWEPFLGHRSEVT